MTSGPATLLSGGITHSGSSFTNLNWTLYTGSFTADAGSATLRLDHTAGGTNGSVFLDAINVSPIPEPTSAAL